MTETYYIDLSQISLAQFQERLQTQDLLPGRIILQEQIGPRFEILAGMGISNLQELHEALKTKKRVSQFAQESGLSLEYLTILRREVNSYRPNPVNLRAFPDVDEDSVARLAAVAIKNSRHLFDQTQTAEQRAALVQQTGITLEALHELIALSDLVRISGIGPVSAHMFYDAGVISSAALAEAEAASLCIQLNDLNQENAYYKGSISEKDVVYCIKLAQKLPSAPV